MATRKSPARLVAEADGLVKLTNKGTRVARFSLLYSGVTPGAADELHCFECQPGKSIEVPKSLVSAVVKLDGRGVAVGGLAPMLVPDQPGYRGVHPSIAGASAPSDEPEPFLPGAA